MKRKDCVLSCPVVKRVKRELFRKVKQSDKDQTERFISLYQSPKSCRLKLLEECKGERCGVKPKWGKYGTMNFHTHPSGDLWPSLSDLLNSIALKKHFCIGAPFDAEHGESTKSKILCWKLPDWTKNYDYGSVNDLLYRLDRHLPIGKRQKRLIQLTDNWQNQCRDRYAGGMPFCEMTEKRYR